MVDALHRVGEPTWNRADHRGHGWGCKKARCQGPARPADPVDATGTVLFDASGWDWFPYQEELWGVLRGILRHPGGMTWTVSGEALDRTMYAAWLLLMCVFAWDVRKVPRIGVSGLNGSLNGPAGHAGDRIRTCTGCPTGT